MFNRSELFRLLKSVAIIGVPLLCGAIYFWLEAPPTGGVYVELVRGDDDVLHEVTGYASETPASAADAAAHSPVSPDFVVQSFFVVGPPGSALLSGAPAAKFFTFVIDDADPAFRSEYVPLPATVRQVNRRAFRVTSSQFPWQPDSIAYKHFSKVIATSLGSRAMKEALIGLELTDAAGKRTMYSVRVGPPR